MSAAYPHVALRAFITNAPDLFAGAGSQKLVGTLTQICLKLHQEGGLPDKIDVPSKFTHVTLAQVSRTCSVRSPYTKTGAETSVCETAMSGAV